MKLNGHRIDRNTDGNNVFASLFYFFFTPRLRKIQKNKLKARRIFKKKLQSNYHLSWSGDQKYEFMHYLLKKNCNKNDRW